MTDTQNNSQKEPYEYIEGHEKLVSFLGHWPTFNDGCVLSVFIDRASRRDGPLVTMSFYLDDIQAAVQGKAFQLEASIRWSEVQAFKHHHTQNLIQIVDTYFAYFEIKKNDDTIETIFHTQTIGTFRIIAKRMEVIEV